MKLGELRPRDFPREERGIFGEIARPFPLSRKPNPRTRFVPGIRTFIFIQLKA